MDDAYITVHNAQVLVQGSDPNYPGTPALVGATSVIHTLMAAGLMKALPPLWALMVVQWIGILLYALGVTRLSRSKSLPGTISVLLLLVALLVFGTAYQLLNGLETGWAMAAMVWALSFAAQSKPSYLLPVFSGILPFLRPELIAFSVLLMCFQLYRRWKDHASPSKYAADLLFAAAGALPWVLILYLNTGDLVPTTVSAKRFFFAEALLPANVKQLWMTNAVWFFLRGLGFFAGALLFVVLDPLGLVSALFMATFLLAYYEHFPGALTHYACRYLYVILPLLLSAAASGAAHRNRIVRTAALILICVSSVSVLWNFPAVWRGYLEVRHHTETELVGMTSFCAANLPPSSKIMIHDAGYVSYALNSRLIDLVGLKTPAAVELHHKLTFPSAGRLRAEAINELALETRPDYLIVLKAWDDIFGITEGIRQRGWELEAVRKPSTDNGSAPYAHYTVYKMSYKSTAPPSSILTQ